MKKKIGKTKLHNNLGLGYETLENRHMMSAVPNDMGLKGLYSQYYRDDRISRNEMISLFNSTKDFNTIDSIEINDLKSIISQSNMPEYVKYFANNIINGSVANNFISGYRLGNLFAGSSSNHMEQLLNKWFLGKDRPTVNGLQNATNYQYVTGAVFVNGASINDIDQGDLGDCYLLSSLGAIARSNPIAIQNMFLYNGDNTWTIRFTRHTDNTNHYVTVDRYLPVNLHNGSAKFASFGGHYNNTRNELWVSLLEKAYVQVCQIPGFRRSISSTRNDYANISGGYSNMAIHHTLGIGSPITSLNNETNLINNVRQNLPMVVAINGHSYTITSYNSQTRKFLFHNPWGHSHLELTWQEMSIKGIARRTAYVVNARFSKPIV